MTYEVELVSAPPVSSWDSANCQYANSRWLYPDEGNLNPYMLLYSQATYTPETTDFIEAAEYPMGVDWYEIFTRLVNTPTSCKLVIDRVWKHGNFSQAPTLPIGNILEIDLKTSKPDIAMLSSLELSTINNASVKKLVQDLVSILYASTSAELETLRAGLSEASQYYDGSGSQMGLTQATRFAGQILYCMTLEELQARPLILKDSSGNDIQPVEPRPEGWVEAHQTFIDAWPEPTAIGSTFWDFFGEGNYILSATKNGSAWLFGVFVTNPDEQKISGAAGLFSKDYQFNDSFVGKNGTGGYFLYSTATKTAIYCYGIDDNNKDNASSSVVANYGGDVTGTTPGWAPTLLNSLSWLGEYGFSVSAMNATGSNKTIFDGRATTTTVGDNLGPFALPNNGAGYTFTQTQGEIEGLTKVGAELLFCQTLFNHHRGSSGNFIKWVPKYATHHDTITV